MTVTGAHPAISTHACLTVPGARTAAPQLSQIQRPRSAEMVATAVVPGLHEPSTDVATAVSWNLYGGGAGADGEALLSASMAALLLLALAAWAKTMFPA